MQVPSLSREPTPTAASPVTLGDDGGDEETILLRIAKFLTEGWNCFRLMETAPVVSYCMTIIRHLSVVFAASFSRLH